MRKEQNNYNKLKRFTAEQGFSLFGIADITKARKKFNLGGKTTAQFNRFLSAGVGIQGTADCSISDHRLGKTVQSCLTQGNWVSCRIRLDRAEQSPSQSFSGSPLPAGYNFNRFAAYSR
jgi:hypothetical protein